MTNRFEDILYFWFKEISPKQHWVKDKAFDAMINRRFGAVYQAAKAGELSNWRKSRRGRLAEIIVLDQFPRNMFRDTPCAFESDALALMLSQELVAKGLEGFTDNQKSFALMPFMHSESRAIQAQSVQLFDNHGLTENIAFAIRHKEIIDQFGRYPHRNAFLGRKSTAEELAFLSQPGSSF